MKTFRTLLGLVLIFPLVALLRAEPVPAKPAPPWKLKDVDGKYISSNQFKGKVVIVDFWATWCPPCRAELPGLIALQKKYGKDGLVIIGISCDQDKNAPLTVKTFMKGNGINFPVVMAEDDTQALFGGMDGIPTTFIIDRAGDIRDRTEGFQPSAVVEEAILKYLK